MRDKDMSSIYECFRKEQMYEQGETSLARGEFSAAADAYRSILKKDPHNFMALRGLLLAAVHLKDMDELAAEDKKGFAYNPELIDEVVEGASEEDKKYFKEFGKIYADKKRLYDLNHDIDSLLEDNKKIDNTISYNNIERDEYYVEGKYGIRRHPKYAFVGLFIATAMEVFPGIFFLTAFEHTEEPLTLYLGWGAIIIGAICLGCNFKFIYPKVKKIEEFDRQTKELEAESSRAAEKLKGLESDADKLRDDLKRAIYEFAEKDKKIVKEKKTSE